MQTPPSALSLCTQRKGIGIAGVSPQSYDADGKLNPLLAPFLAYTFPHEAPHQTQNLVRGDRMFRL